MAHMPHLVGQNRFDVLLGQSVDERLRENDVPQSARETHDCRVQDRITGGPEKNPTCTDSIARHTASNRLLRSPGSIGFNPSNTRIRSGV